MSFLASFSSAFFCALLMLVLPVLGHAHDADEGLERGLEVTQVDVAPALFIDGVRIDARLGELLDLLVEAQRAVHLALVEIELGERQVRVGDVLRVRVVLDEAEEELARLILLLHRGQHVGELEEHLVHALVLLELGGGDVALDRLEQPLLLLLLVAGLLALQRRLAAGRGVEDLLIERARLVVVEALLVGVELGDAEPEVGLLRIAVIGDLDEAGHLGDLLVDQLLQLSLLLLDELVDA